MTNLTKARLTTLLLAASIASGVAASARADVVYDLTFDNSAGTVSEGTGTLTLNYSTIAQVESVSHNLSAANFTSLVTTSIDSDGSFTITPSNLANGSFSTSPSGTFYSLTVAETVPSCDNNGTCDILVLDLYTNTWQIHDKYNSQLTSGDLVVSGPTLVSGSDQATTPVPSTLPLFATGLGAIAFFGWLRKRRGAAGAAALPT